MFNNNAGIRMMPKGPLVRRRRAAVRKVFELQRLLEAVLYLDHIGSVLRHSALRLAVRVDRAGHGLRDQLCRLRPQDLQPVRRDAETGEDRIPFPDDFENGAKQSGERPAGDSLDVIEHRHILEYQEPERHHLMIGHFQLRHRKGVDRRILAEPIGAIGPLESHIRGDRRCRPTLDSLDDVAWRSICHLNTLTVFERQSPSDRGPGFLPGAKAGDDQEFQPECVMRDEEGSSPGPGAQRGLDEALQHRGLKPHRIGRREKRVVPAGAEPRLTHCLAEGLPGDRVAGTGPCCR